MILVVSEFESILKQAGALAAKLKITREEALLLIIARELACIHFHVDAVLAPRKE